MLRKRRILFVAMQNSIHTARWIALLREQNWKVYLLPVAESHPHPDLRDVIIFSGISAYRPRGLDRSTKVIGIWPFRRHAFLIARLLYLLTGKRFDRKSWLKLVIRWVKPDIVHSLEFQMAGYLCYDVKASMGSRFPTWIATNWGSDIYLFGRLPGHEKPIRQVLENCDYYSCECERDVQLARDNGFRGQVLPVLPNSGGLDLPRVRALRRRYPTSARRLIVIKGYQHWSGRALFGFRALEMCSDHLQGYRVAIFSPLHLEDVSIAAQLLAQSIKIPVEVLTECSHERILELHGQARISIGLSISDAISTSLLEAMAMGSFPIQSCTACADEWTEDGISSFIVPPEDPVVLADRIRRAVKDDQLVDRAAEINARTIAAACDRQSIQRQVIDIYDAVLSGTYVEADEPEVLNQKAVGSDIG